MTDHMRCAGAAFMLLIGAAGLAGATEFHVSPSASSNGNGSRSNPWLINAALQSLTVQPGDTITLDGGTYVNPTNGQGQVAFACTITGSSTRPIIVRAAPGQHVTLDGADSQQYDILRISGSYVWVQGLEIFSSSPNRYSPSGGSFPPVSEIQRGYCLAVSQTPFPVGVKVINCILHDGFGGFDAWGTAGTELYGCLLYNNGWLASDKNHGHNIYIQNVAGSQRESNACINWGAFEQLVQAYGTHNTDDFSFDQNISFAPVDGGFLVGGALPANNLSITNSYFYSGTIHAPIIDMGWNPYGAGLANATITGNYIGGGRLKFQMPITGNISANTIYYGSMSGANESDFPNNTWTTSPPATNKIVVIANKYEPGRANIAVYNWSHAGSVQVDLTGVVKPGDRYEIMDAQNPSVIVASGSYSDPASISMNGLVAAQPVGPGSGQGQGTRTHTAPEFGAFIVVTTVFSNVKIKFYLQGPYVSSGDTMSNSLNSSGLLASHFRRVPVPSTAVDSVNIEIRNSATNPTMRVFVPAWLLTDGTIRDFADTTKTYLRFGGVPSGNYFVVVRHRNHLAIMSSVSVSIDGGVTPAVYDFSTGQGRAYGTNAQRLVGTRYAMAGGDGTGDGSVDAIDRNAVWRVQNGAYGYLNGDFTLDGGVDAFDLNQIWRSNNGSTTQVP